GRRPRRPDFQNGHRPEGLAPTNGRPSTTTASPSVELTSPRRTRSGSSLGSVSVRDNLTSKEPPSSDRHGGELPLRNPNAPIRLLRSGSFVQTGCSAVLTWNSLEEPPGAGKRLISRDFQGFSRTESNRKQKAPTSRAVEAARLWRGWANKDAV